MSMTTRTGHFSRTALASLCLAAMSAGFSGQAAAAPLQVDVAGIQSQGELGSAANTVLSFNVGAGARITSLDWSVSLLAHDPSWLSDISLVVSGSDLSAGGVLFQFAKGSDHAGAQAYAGSVNLVNEGLDFGVGADGVLRLEFSELASEGLRPDGAWTSGSLGFGVSAVPEPAAYGLMALGLVLLGGFVRGRKHSGI